MSDAKVSARDRGHRGPHGPRGHHGADGADGADGVPGADGATGPTGPSGGGGGTVVSDGTSVHGDGSIGDPLGTVAGGTAIVTDGVTIFGDGTTGNPIFTSGTVTTDQETILGNGSSGDPLRTNIPAMGSVTNGGAGPGADWLSETGFAGDPVRNSTGSVTMTLLNPPPGFGGSAQIIPTVALQTGAGRISVSVAGDKTITVLTFDAAGAAADVDFYIIVGIADPF